MKTESKRQQKFARQIQKEMANIFQSESQNIIPGEFITITKAKVSPDLRLARIYISLFKSKHIDQSLLKINEHKKNIRYILGNRIKEMRRVPEIVFFIDDTQDYVSYMDKVFDKINSKANDDEKI